MTPLSTHPFIVIGLKSPSTGEMYLSPFACFFRVVTSCGLKQYQKARVALSGFAPALNALHSSSLSYSIGQDSQQIEVFVGAVN